MLGKPAEGGISFIFIFLFTFRVPLMGWGGGGGVGVGCGVFRIMGYLVGAGLFFYIILLSYLFCFSLELGFRC